MRCDEIRVYVDESAPEWIKQYVSVIEDGIRLMCRKRHDYGTENVESLGVKGAFVRLWDKAHRLKRLIWDEVEREVGDETVEDTLIDLMNYAFMVYRLWRTGRWK